MRWLVLFIGILLCPLMALANPDRWRQEWPQTDFAQTSITNWSEIRSGGPGKDGIPALDAPQFLAVGHAPYLAAREPVITVAIKGARPRAYPLRYLTWHEIANDEVAGIPIAVTFCPLCNSAITFDRRVNGRVISFGVSGKLRHSDMVMYDRETLSWWQQAQGLAIVGELTGKQLRSLPSWVESWQAFVDRYPDGLVMAEPAFARSYGRNPYRGYDTSKWPFLYDGAPPPHGVAPLARVVRVGNRAWPLARLERVERIDEAGVQLTWRKGQGSALDSGDIRSGREIGNVRVKNARGQDVPHDVMFAFAFHAFWPDGIWMLEP